MAMIHFSFQKRENGLINFNYNVSRETIPFNKFAVSEIKWILPITKHSLWSLLIARSPQQKQRVHLRDKINLRLLQLSFKYFDIYG